MKRLLVLSGVAVAAILAFRHPSGASRPALATIEQTPRPSRVLKGRSFAGTAMVYVVGAVVRPGLYRLNGGSRVDDAVKSAGGFTAAADRASVNLAETVADGDEVHVLRSGEASVSRRVPARNSRVSRARKSRRSRPMPQAPIDLNSAGADALASLPGVGTTLAARIVEYRQLNGPFTSVDELADVAGMTQRRVDALASYLRIGAAP